MPRFPVALIAFSAAAAAMAQPAPQCRNWFDDPFFQISGALAGCPAPAGPCVTESERRAQSHHRAERGTTCWLAGACDKPNDYAYDEGIATALKDVFAGGRNVPDSTLWVTVQGRIVYIEGCVSDESAAARIEAAARAVPNVRQAVAAVYSDPHATPPYRLRESP